MENRTRRLTIRFTSNEYRYIERRFRRSTLRNVSEYAREVLLGKPLIFTYRNQSMDETQEELIKIRREINYIGNNFNQAVYKLNSVMGMPDTEVWENTMVILRDQIEPMMRETKEAMNSISERWSQK